MQTVYLVKGTIYNQTEFLCGIFSTISLADKYIEDSLKYRDDTKYKVELWKVDGALR